MTGGPNPPHPHRIPPRPPSTHRMGGANQKTEDARPTTPQRARDATNPRTRNLRWRAKASIERSNERTNERSNERTSERANERTVVRRRRMATEGARTHTHTHTDTDTHTLTHTHTHTQRPPHLLDLLDVERPAVVRVELCEDLRVLLARLVRQQSANNPSSVRHPSVIRPSSVRHPSVVSPSSSLSSCDDTTEDGRRSILASVSRTSGAHGGYYPVVVSEQERARSITLMASH